jgi:hypothetical protein
MPFKMILAFPNEFGFSDEQQKTQIAKFIQKIRGVSIPITRIGWTDVSFHMLCHITFHSADSGALS